MSYMGPDPGEVEFCPVCGGELWPFPDGDHRECEATWRKWELEAREALTGQVEMKWLDDDNPEEAAC